MLNRIAQYVPNFIDVVTDSSVGRENLEVEFRSLIRPDVEHVVRIDAESFESPWSYEDFRQCLRKRSGIGMVAECDGRVVGFAIYELQEDALNLLRMAVDVKSRRRSVGTQIIQRLREKLKMQRRSSLFLFIREANLAAQLFLRSLGAKALYIVDEHFEDGEDAYLFQSHSPDQKT